MGNIVKDAARVLSSQDGRSGQICLGTGLFMTELKTRGMTHIKRVQVDAGNSLLSLYPQKSAAGGAVPLDFRKHGGVFVPMPVEVAGWLGSRWVDNFKGRGWVTVDVLHGKSGSMRLLLPSKDQLLKAASQLAQLPFYPGFD